MDIEFIIGLKKTRDIIGEKYAQTDDDSRKSEEIKNEFNDEDGLDKYNELFIRNNFSKDRDRIKFSRSFRRLQHKAQIYSHEKGDHFRTRLTHTLEVLQIAKSIAKNLNLNEDLVEAITLGHDIGHTPFGHQGERVLDQIMSGEECLSGKIKYKIDCGGFKHNFNSLKRLDLLEVKAKNYRGMNLTKEVLEGILKHTKFKINDEIKWDLVKFVNKESKLKDYYLDCKNSVTLEGQVVAIADEIAQRQHDVDDGLRDSDLKLNFEEISEELINELKEIDIKNIKENQEGDKYDKLIEICYFNLRELIESIEELKEINNDNLYKVNKLVRDIINFFIKDVTTKSLYKLKVMDEENQNENKIFKTNYISFSENIGKKVNDIIEKYINSKIINSYNVNRFDGKAIYIVKQLFKAYYTNPRQMQDYVLKRLLKNIKDVFDLVKEIDESIFDSSNSDKENTKIKFIKSNSLRDLDPKLMKKLLGFMKLEKFEFLKSIGFEDIDNLLDEEFENKLNEINIKLKDYFYKEDIINKKLKDALKEFLKNCSKENLKYYLLLEVHYLYLASICDYIAGMTDNYAKDEFKKLYLV